jgi:hypothetical protein
LTELQDLLGDLNDARTGHGSRPRGGRRLDCSVQQS